MAGMVPHAGQPLDDGGHPQQGPQIGREAVGSRPLAERAIDLFELPDRELRLATGSAGRSERGHAAPPPCPVPATDTLAAHAECPSDQGGNLAGAEQLSGPQAPPF